MLAVLKLEYIGENYHSAQRAGAQAQEQTARYGRYLGRNRSRPWVARLTGLDADGWSVRVFVRGQIDYSRANSTGSRGVYCYYPLSPGFYEVNARESWNHVRRYFLRVVGTEMHEISEEEVHMCLRSASA